MNTENYLHDELYLKQARLVLHDVNLTIEMNQKSIVYTNDYTSFSFDSDSNELKAPHFKLIINNKADAIKIIHWMESFYI